LRAEAEARFARAPPESNRAQSTSALLHELQVHQIELEMQNEELRRDHLELEEANARFVDLYDFAPVGYLTLDTRGVITGANLTAADLLGKERKGLLGRRFPALVPSADADRWHRFFSALVQQDQRAACRLALSRGDGSTFDAHLACERRGEGSAEPSVRVVLNDVSEFAQTERALLESERWLRMSQEIARIGHYVFDVPGDRWTSSPVLDAILGIDDAFLRSAAGWIRIVHPEDRASMESYLGALLGSGSRFDREYRVADQRSGEVRWVHGLGELQRGQDGKPIQLVGTIQDVTARKRADAERAELYGKLALSARLAAMGTLVAGVAHEINNPLAAALADQGLAMEGAQEVRDRLRVADPLDREDAARRLDAMVEELADAQEGGRRIAQIVRDLVSFGRPSATRTRVRLIDVIEKAMRWLPATAGQAASVKVEDGGAPDVLASSGQVEQVVANLLTNGVKATVPGRPNRIIVRVGAGSPGMARLDVIDQGKGIAPAIRERIFEPFFTDGVIGQGTGLGLAICNHIVKAHGGTLTVESAVGKGSTFRVDLPVAPDA
jgi:PAS domain S-box-containing protein